MYNFFSQYHRDQYHNEAVVLNIDRLIGSSAIAVIYMYVFELGL